MPPATSTAAHPETTRPQSRHRDARHRDAQHRDPALDNAKFLLILLVVAGHSINYGANTGAGDLLYFWIYLFHMPAFVLICGYLSKSYDGSARRVDTLITSIAVPYLVFWSLYSLQYLSAGRNVPDGPLHPVHLTWFLAALFVWRLSVPIWRRIRWPIGVSLGVALAAGVVETGPVLDISRILSLLPFFVVGLLLRREHLEYLRRRWVRVCALLVVAGSAVLTYTHLEALGRDWVFWRDSLADRGVDILPYGLALRVGFLALALALAAAVLSLTPERRTWITRLGALTLYVYLLHGLALKVSAQLGVYRYIGDVLDGHGALAVRLGMALLWTLVLCSPWVRGATRWAVEPNVDWLLRRRPRVTEPVTAR